MKHEHEVCKKRNNIRNWNFKATSIKKCIFLKFRVWFVCILFEYVSPTPKDPGSTVVGRFAV